jgi:hypothetical protein
VVVLSVAANYAGLLTVSLFAGLPTMTLAKAGAVTNTSAGIRREMGFMGLPATKVLRWAKAHPWRRLEKRSVVQMPAQASCQRLLLTCRSGVLSPKVSQGNSTLNNTKVIYRLRR